MEESRAEGHELGDHRASVLQQRYALPTFRKAELWMLQPIWLTFILKLGLGIVRQTVQERGIEKKDVRL